MDKSEAPRVEHLSRKKASPAVKLITQDGMAKVLEMNADLMRPARVQRAFDDAAPGNLAPNPPLRFCLPALRDHRHALPMHRMPADRLLARPAHCGKPARDQREINLRHFAPGKLRGERLMRLIVFCHHQTAARFFIEPMDDPRTLHAADPGKPCAMMQQRV